MQIHLARMEENEHIFDKSAKKPVKFLSFVKKTGIVHLQDALLLEKHGTLGLIDGLNDGTPFNIFTAITEKIKGKSENDRLLRVMPRIFLKKSFKIRCENSRSACEFVY